MLEKKLYETILFVSLFISIMSIIINVISGVGIIINIKWVILLMMVMFLFYQVKHKENVETSKFIYSLCVIMILMPYTYINSGGSTSSFLGYIFLVLISITYLFKNIKRIVLISILTTTFILLQILEYIYPELIVIYSSRVQFIDRLTQIPMLMLVSYFIVKKFADAYEEKKILQNKYSEELENANERLEFLANYDELTSLYNRRVFNRVLDEIKENETMNNSDIYIGLIDVDFFKRINDDYSHLTGDKILIEFSSKLKDLIKEPNIISRWGGDEFSLIFYGSEQELIGLLNNIEKVYSNVVNTYGISSGISIGGTKWEKDMNIAEVMKLVDHALYKSKDLGRGIITINDVLEMKSVDNKQNVVI